MTVHNHAPKKAIAPFVLMPGDPLRAKWIAETFLQDAKEVNNIRNMLAFTGYYQNQLVTVMGHGMGMASIGIYSYELFHFYNVQAIIRIGSCGTYQKDINIGDLLLVDHAYSNSTYAQEIGVQPVDYCLKGDTNLNAQIIKIAKQNHFALKRVIAHSSDVFYGAVKTIKQIKAETKADVVEMESFALFANAIKLQKQAACLLTCSDSVVDERPPMSAEARSNQFVKMAHLALLVATQNS